MIEEKNDTKGKNTEQEIAVVFLGTHEEKKCE